jgi:sortase A
MKKLVSIILLCGVLGLLLAVHQKSTLQSTNSISQKGQRITNQASPTPTPGVPKSFSIPNIGVTAHIESVGLDSEKRMDVPENVQDVAWYDLGARPGAIGSAVIDGHLDTQTGAPAVFYYLKNLKDGDTIQITDQNGKTYTFRVTNVTTYPYDQLPLKDIFASADKPHLNLITCGGTWDKVKKNYSNRTVVYAELTGS